MAQQVSVSSPCLLQTQSGQKQLLTAMVKGSSCNALTLEDRKLQQDREPERVTASSDNSGQRLTPPRPLFNDLPSAFKHILKTTSRELEDISKSKTSTRRITLGVYSEALIQDPFERLNTNNPYRNGLFQEAAKGTAEASTTQSENPGLSRRDSLLSRISTEHESRPPDVFSGHKSLSSNTSHDCAENEIISAYAHSTDQDWGVLGNADIRRSLPILQMGRTESTIGDIIEQYRQSYTASTSQDRDGIRVVSRAATVQGLRRGPDLPLPQTPRVERVAKIVSECFTIPSYDNTRDLLRLSGCTEDDQPEPLKIRLELSSPVSPKSDTIEVTELAPTFEFAQTIATNSIPIAAFDAQKVAPGHTRYNDDVSMVSDSISESSIDSEDELEWETVAGSRRTLRSASHLTDPFTADQNPDALTAVKSFYRIESFTPPVFTFKQTAALAAPPRAYRHPPPLDLDATNPFVDVPPVLSKPDAVYSPVYAFRSPSLSVIPEVTEHYTHNFVSGSSIALSESAVSETTADAVHGSGKFEKQVRGLRSGANMSLLPQIRQEKRTHKDRASRVSYDEGTMFTFGTNQAHGSQEFAAHSNTNRQSYCHRHSALSPRLSQRSSVQIWPSSSTTELLPVTEQPRLQKQFRIPSSTNARMSGRKQRLSWFAFGVCAVFPYLLILYGYGVFDPLIEYYTHGDIRHFGRIPKRYAKLCGWSCAAATVLSVAIVFAVRS